MKIGLAEKNIFQHSSPVTTGREENAKVKKGPARSAKTGMPLKKRGAPILPM
jgi:hypothetical protein